MTRPSPGGATDARRRRRRVQGAVFPRGPDGRRGSMSLGRAVVAQALAAADPAAGTRVRQVADWRRGYLGPFRQLVEAGLGSPGAALAIAARGCAALHERMRVIGPAG